MRLTVNNGSLCDYAAFELTARDFVISLRCDQVTALVVIGQRCRIREVPHKAQADINIRFSCICCFTVHTHEESRAVLIKDNTDLAFQRISVMASSAEIDTAFLHAVKCKGQIRVIDLIRRSVQLDRINAVIHILVDQDIVRSQIHNIDIKKSVFDIRCFHPPGIRRGFLIIGPFLNLSESILEIDIIVINFRHVIIIAVILIKSGFIVVIVDTCFFFEFFLQLFIGDIAADIIVAEFAQRLRIARMGSRIAERSSTFKLSARSYCADNVVLTDNISLREYSEIRQNILDRVWLSVKSGYFVVCLCRQHRGEIAQREQI